MMGGDHAYQQTRRSCAARHFGAGPFRLRNRSSNPGLPLPGDACSAGPELRHRADESGRPWAGSNSPRYAELVAQNCRPWAMPARRRSIRRRWSSTSAMASTTPQTEIVSYPFAFGYRLRLLGSLGIWPGLGPRLLLGAGMIPSGMAVGCYNDIRSYTYYVSAAGPRHSAQGRQCRRCSRARPMARSRTDDAEQDRAEPGRGDVHRLPRQFGRDGQDHDSARRQASRCRFVLSDGTNKWGPPSPGSHQSATLMGSFPRRALDQLGTGPLPPGACAALITPQISPPAGASAGGCRHQARNPRRAAARSA